MSQQLTLPFRFTEYCNGRVYWSVNKRCLTRFDDLGELIDLGETPSLRYKRRKKPQPAVKSLSTNKIRKAIPKEKPAKRTTKEEQL